MMTIRRTAALGALAAMGISGLWAETRFYTLDPTHSNAGFSVKHLMISNVRGNFSKLEGTAQWDPKDPTAAQLHAAIDVSSVDTREPKRDAHLKSADFLDAAKYPQMKFESTKFETKTNQLLMTGNLTIRGVTKPVTFVVDGPSAPIKDPWGNVRLGASATTRINRKDFGLSFNAAMDGGGVVVGDDVDITLDVELVQKKGQ